MKIKLLISSIIIGLVSLGCTPAKLVSIPSSSDNNQSEVNIQRVSSFNAVAIEAIVGANNSDYLTLSSGEAQKLSLPTGKYEFFVRSNQFDQPNKMFIELINGQEVCLQIKPNPNNIAKSLVPFSFFMGNTFFINKVDCSALEH